MDEFDTLFATAPAKAQYASDQSKQVADGEYECEIRSAVMKDTSSGKVFTFTGTILSDGPYRGYALEHTIFFSKKNGTDEEKAEYKKKQLGNLKKDFTTLGFDADNWTPEKGRLFSAQMPIACALAKGMVVKMRKKVTDTGENVYLNRRLADKDGKPAKFGAAEMVMPAGAAQAATSTAGQSAPVGFGSAEFGDGAPAGGAAPAGTSLGEPIQW